MHLSMISAMMGGVGGFPRGIGSEGYSLVGILTLMRCPRVGNDRPARISSERFLRSPCLRA